MMQRLVATCGLVSMVMQNYSRSRIRSSSRTSSILISLTGAWKVMASCCRTRAARAQKGCELSCGSRKPYGSSARSTSTATSSRQVTLDLFSHLHGVLQFASLVGACHSICPHLVASYNHGQTSYRRLQHLRKRFSLRLPPLTRAQKMGSGSASTCWAACRCELLRKMVVRKNWGLFFLCAPLRATRPASHRVWRRKRRL
mmetsp:Transcript_38273/g.67510  ORF Transcript_38273/g.67510 Transcript_38273/m.67510 type:complete len:200 (+) Transcript_38273:876-1475(+)